MHVKIFGPSHRHSVGSVNRIHGYGNGYQDGRVLRPSPRGAKALRDTGTDSMGGSSSVGEGELRGGSIIGGEGAARRRSAGAVQCCAVLVVKRKED